MVRSTRSQPGPSQPTQTQRRAPRRSRAQSEDEADEPAPTQTQANATQGDEDEDMEGGRRSSDLARRVNDLVRLALFTEYKRAPLKRDEISKKVLGPHTRAFNVVFEGAQQKLRKTFGMELVEVPTRAALDEENAADEELDDIRQATGVRKKAASGTKSYILRSCLAPALIEQAAQTDQAIKVAEAEDQRILMPQTGDDNGDEDEKYFGTLISWGTADQLGPIGILYIILGLILVGGKLLPDAELRRHLKALSLPSKGDAPVHFTDASPIHHLSVDDYLTQLQRLNYLDSFQAAEGGAKKVSKKNAKRVRVEEDGDRTLEWKWGPRAHCEVGEQASAKFIAEFMVATLAEDVDEEPEDAARQEALLVKMLQGVTKAAGGNLAGVR